MIRNDLTGRKFGQLTVLEFVGKNKHRQSRWLCKCDCGQETEVTGNGLTTGNTKSCGRCPNRIDHFGDAIIIWLERKKGNPLPCFIDASDYSLVKDFRWHAIARPTEQAIYAESGTEPKVRMHNLLLAATEFEVDHIDHDGLNNRRENLRPGNHAQNSQNRRKFRTSRASHFKGVGPHGRKFRASINVGGKRIHLGLFDSELDAARAYNDAAKKHFGEFAELNETEDARLVFENQN